MDVSFVWLSDVLLVALGLQVKSSSAFALVVYSKEPAPTLHRPDF
jgi:hypothetical protein